MHFLCTFALKCETKFTRMKRKLKVTQGPRLNAHMVYTKHTRPLLSMQWGGRHQTSKSPPIPTYPGFHYWEICRGMWGFVSPILSQLVGNCNFQECKSPPQPVPGVVGHYIDRVLIFCCSIFLLNKVPECILGLLKCNSFKRQLFSFLTC